MPTNFPIGFFSQSDLTDSWPGLNIIKPDLTNSELRLSIIKLDLTDMKINLIFVMYKR